MDSGRKEWPSGECTGRLAQHGVSICGKQTHLPCPCPLFLLDVIFTPVSCSGQSQLSWRGVSLGTTGGSGLHLSWRGCVPGRPLSIRKARAVLPSSVGASESPRPHPSALLTFVLGRLWLGHRGGVSDHLKSQTRSLCPEYSLQGGVSSLGSGLPGTRELSPRASHDRRSVGVRLGSSGHTPLLPYL